MRDGLLHYFIKNTLFCVLLISLKTKMLFSAFSSNANAFSKSITRNIATANRIVDYASFSESQRENSSTVGRSTGRL